MYFKNYGKFKTLLASLFGDSSSSALQCSSSLCRFGKSFYSQAGCKLVDNCMFLREIFYIIYLPWIRYFIQNTRIFIEDFIIKLPLNKIGSV